MSDTDLKVISFYANKIHSNPAFYEAGKNGVVKYQVEGYNSDDKYKQKKKEYCKLKIREIYQKKSNNSKHKFQ